MYIAISGKVVLVVVFEHKTFNSERASDDLDSEMRNVCLVVELEYIINTVDIKQIDSPAYWPIKHSICVNTQYPLRAQSLRFYVFKGQLFFN